MISKSTRLSYFGKIRRRRTDMCQRGDPVVWARGSAEVTTTNTKPGSMGPGVSTPRVSERTFPSVLEELNYINRTIIVILLLQHGY